MRTHGHPDKPIKLVPLGAAVRSSCGQAVGVVRSVSNDPPCPRCDVSPAVRVEVAWPDGARRWYCANGIVLDEIYLSENEPLSYHLLKGFCLGTQQFARR